MTNLRAIELAGAAALGALLTWLMPDGWFIDALVGAIGVTLIVGVLAAASARSETPTRVGTQFVLFLVLGTNRPGARVADARALRLFLLGAAAIGGLVLGVFLLPIRP